MRSSTTGIYPQNVFEAEILPKSSIYDFDGHGHECPAFVADVGFRAAGTNFIVIRQIEIEDHLFGYGTKGRGFAEGFTIARIGRIYWADFESGWIYLEDLFAEAAGISKERSVSWDGSQV